MPGHLWRRLPGASKRLVAGLHGAGVQARLARGQPAGAGVVADHVHAVQLLDDLAGLLGVPKFEDVAVGALAGGGVGVDDRVAAAGEAGQAGADQGDLVAPLGQPLRQPADLLQAA
jgi:hypothetical protein